LLVEKKNLGGIEKQNKQNMNRWFQFLLVAMLVGGVVIALKQDAPSGKPPPCPPDCTKAGVVCPPFCTRKYKKKPPPKHSAPVPIGTKILNVAEKGRQWVDTLLTGNSTKTNQKNGSKTGAQVGCSGKVGAKADAFSKQCASGVSCGGYCVSVAEAKKSLLKKTAEAAETGRQTVDKLLTGNSTKTNQKNGFKTGAQVGCSGKVGAKADAFSKQCASGVSCGGYCVSVAEAKKSLLKKTAEAAESGRQSVDTLLTGNSTKTNQKDGFKTGAQVGCSGGAGAAADAFSKQCKSGQSCAESSVLYCMPAVP
jgi:hypothetical protein